MYELLIQPCVHVLAFRKIVMASEQRERGHPEKYLDHHAAYAARDDATIS
jgi:hypothetical protein